MNTKLFRRVNVPCRIESGHVIYDQPVSVDKNTVMDFKYVSRDGALVEVQVTIQPLMSVYFDRLRQRLADFIYRLKTA